MFSLFPKKLNMTGSQFGKYFKLCVDASGFDNSLFHFQELKNNTTEWKDVGTYNENEVIITLNQDSNIGDRYRCVLTRGIRTVAYTNSVPVDKSPSGFVLRAERNVNNLFFVIDNPTQIQTEYELQYCAVNSNRWVKVGNVDTENFNYTLPVYTSVGDKYRCLILNGEFEGFCTTSIDINKTYSVIKSRNISQKSIGSLSGTNAYDPSSKSTVFDLMSGEDFEFYCVDLLKANGFEKVKRTPTSGDFGVDILAEKDGLRYAFQCKCFSKPVSNKAVQEVFSGMNYYDCAVGVVLTNSTFQPSAIKTAEKNRIQLWDRTKLFELLANANRMGNGDDNV